MAFFSTSIRIPETLLITWIDIISEMSYGPPLGYTYGKARGVVADALRGYIFRYYPVVQTPSQNLKVTWSWYDESNGIVKWTFKNVSGTTRSGILFRGVLVNGQNVDPYYFGDAYWAIYYANSDGRGASATNPEDNFGVEWMTEITPLVDKGVQDNVAPIAPVLLDGKTWVIAFIFTLSPGQTWEMLEGGFSSSMLPAPVGVYEVTPASSSNPVQEMCIGYNPQAVLDWDMQTLTNFQGYYPNPSTFKTIPFTVVGAPAVSVFGDRVTYGKCNEKDCGVYLSKAMDAFKKGNVIEGLRYVAQAAECYA